MGHECFGLNAVQIQAYRCLFARDPGETLGTL
jgi:hypothetical protein